MDKEPKVEYGSPEYFEKMKRWDKFFKHHYKNNSHHPAHYNEQGIYGMTIVDLVEMIVLIWKDLVQISLILETLLK